MLQLMLALVAVTGDGPYVTIRDSAGAVAGRWEGVRIEMFVQNRLPADVTELEVEVGLVSAPKGGQGEQPIPGWRFDQSFPVEVFAAGDETTAWIERPLAARRRFPPTSDIAYHVRIKSYRLREPTLALTAQLLMSSAASDQRAALRSYEPEAFTVISGRPPEAPGSAEIRRVIAHPMRDPGPADALELFLAIRAAGALADPAAVAPLLALPAKLETRAWTDAVVELIARMRADSYPDDPRLEILPADPGDRTSIPRELVRAAILRIGDAAIPELVQGAGKGGLAFAQEMLRAMGRSTLRAQLSVPDSAVKIRVLEVLSAADPAVVELLAHRDPEVHSAAARALVRIGAPAVPVLVAALDTPNLRAPAIEVLDRLSKPGVARELLATAEARSKARWAAEIERGIGLGKDGSYEEAFRVLDRAYAAAPAIYVQRAEAIAKVYLEHGKALLARRNYDAAAEALRIARGLSPLPEIAPILSASQHALAQGYLELDELDRADEAVQALEDADEARLLSARILGRRAEIAFRRGEYARSRVFLDRARGLTPTAPDLERAHQRLLLLENLAIVFVLALLIPTGTISLIVLLRRRRQARRMRALL